MKFLKLKLLFFGIATFSLAACTSKSREFQSKLLPLIQQSQQSKDICDRYNLELGKTAEVKQDGDTEAFKDRQVALNVLKKLEEHPETPKATQEAGFLIVSQSPKTLETAWFVQNIGNLQHFCGIIQFYVNLRRLIEGKEKYKLSPPELARMKKIALHFVESESSYPGTLVSVLIQIALLNQLSEAGMLGPKELFQDRIHVLSLESQELKERVKNKINSKQGKSDQDFAEDFIFEIFETNKIREKIKKLMFPT